jgi:hypothetical protein
MVKMLLEREYEGELRRAVILEADGGISAVECLRNEISAGQAIDFVLMDFVMVIFLTILPSSDFSSSCESPDENAWSTSRFCDA